MSENEPTFKELEEAVKRGDINAQFKLGLAYRAGIIVNKDLKKGRELIRTAAKNGDSEAKDYLKKESAASLGSFFILAAGIGSFIYCYKYWLNDASWWQAFLRLNVPLTVILSIAGIIFKKTKVNSDTAVNIHCISGLFYAISAVIVANIKGIYGGFWMTSISVIAYLAAAFVSLCFGIAFSGNEKK